MKQFTAAGIAAAFLVVLPTASFAAATTEPDATIELKEGSVAAGIGYTWGKGTLHYQGKSIPVTVKGLSVASIGAGSITASGDVYHLGKLSDFDGNYTAVSAGAALAGGGSVAAMQNANGVVIHMRSTTQGVSLNLSVDGVSLKLKK
jgi:hypothetical protein